MEEELNTDLISPSIYVHSWCCWAKGFWRICGPITVHYTNILECILEEWYTVLDRSKEISIFFLIYHLDGFDWREKSMTVKYEESGVLVQKVKMNTKDVR